MKHGARVLNCARGGIINEEALVEALTARGTSPAPRWTSTCRSRCRPTIRCCKLPNVVLTPHLGASTVEAQESVALEAAQLLIDYPDARRHPVSPSTWPPVDRTELEEMRLYVDLARRLGLLHAQMCQGAIQRAELHYRGEVARRSTKLITAAFAAGLLEYRLGESVNIVNAELLARERGIEIVEQISPKKGDFSTLIQARRDDRQKEVHRRRHPVRQQYLLRLVQLGPYHLDTYIDGIMLLVHAP